MGSDFSSLFITFAMLSFNMLGDGLLQYMLKKQKGMIAYKEKRIFPLKKRPEEMLETIDALDKCHQQTKEQTPPIQEERKKPAEISS
jgi:hypothetical protein